MQARTKNRTMRIAVKRILRILTVGLLFVLGGLGVRDANAGIAHEMTCVYCSNSAFVDLPICEAVQEDKNQCFQNAGANSGTRLKLGKSRAGDPGITFSSTDWTPIGGDWCPDVEYGEPGGGRWARFLRTPAGNWGVGKCPEDQSGVLMKWCSSHGVWDEGLSIVRNEYGLCFYPPSSLDLAELVDNDIDDMMNLVESPHEYYPHRQWPAVLGYPWASDGGIGQVGDPLRIDPTWIKIRITRPKSEGGEPAIVTGIKMKFKDFRIPEDECGHFKGGNIYGVRWRWNPLECLYTGYFTKDDVGCDFDTCEDLNPRVLAVFTTRSPRDDPPSDEYVMALNGPIRSIAQWPLGKSTIGFGKEGKLYSLAPYGNQEEWDEIGISAVAISDRMDPSDRERGGDMEVNYRGWNGNAVLADYIYLYYDHGYMSFLSIDIETKAPGYRPCAPYSYSQDACENKPGNNNCTWVYAEDELTAIAAQLTNRQECEAKVALTWDSDEGTCESQSGHVCAPAEQEYYHRNEGIWDIDYIPEEAGAFTYMRGEWTDISESDNEHWQRAMGSLEWAHDHDGEPCESRVNKNWVRSQGITRESMKTAGGEHVGWKEVDDPHADHVDAEHPGWDCIGDCTYEGLQVSNCEWERGECIQKVSGKGEKSYTPPCHYGEYLIHPQSTLEFLCPINKQNKRFIAGKGLKPSHYGPQYSIRRAHKFNAKKCEQEVGGLGEFNPRDDRDQFSQNLRQGLYSPPAHYSESFSHPPNYNEYGHDWEKCTHKDKW